MSAGLIVYAAAAVLAVDTGWQPAPDGGLEYIIQVEPQLLDLMRDGQVIQSEIPADLQGVRRYRIQVGTEPLPRVGLPTTAARPTDPPLGNEPAPVVEGAPVVVEPAPSAESPLPSARPLSPPAPLRSIVPPAEAAAPASVDGAPAPARRIISSEPRAGESAVPLVEPVPLDATSAEAAPSPPAEAPVVAGPVPALKPLPGREPVVRRSPAEASERDAASVDPRPSLPVDASVPVAPEASIAVGEPYPEETYPLSVPLRREPAPFVEPTDAANASSPAGASPSETTSRTLAGSPTPSGSEANRPAPPRLGTTPRFIYVPPPKPAANASAAPGEASAPANDGPKLGLDENVVLPQEPIKVIDPVNEPAKADAAKSPPPAPAVVEATSSVSGAATKNAVSAAPRAQSPNRVAPQSDSAAPTIEPTPNATEATAPARAEAPPAATAPTIPATAPVGASPNDAMEANLNAGETAGSKVGGGAWDWLGTRRNASRPYSTPPSIEATEPAASGAESNASSVSTTEAIDPSASKSEATASVQLLASSDATGDETEASDSIAGGAVRLGSWTVPAAAVVVALVASLGGNLFLGWVAWGMQSKFARLAEQYQISQWKSPPTP
ncbi:MAG TPA: hypothetical protein VGE52_17725 [Pirellulales bacterium]